MSASPTRIMTSEPMPAFQRKSFMREESELKIGQSFHSKRSGRKITIIALEDDKIYYTVEDFKTIAPLFLPREKFLYLVGIADISE